MRDLLLATRNQGKIRELKALLGEINARLLTLGDLDIELEVEETGDSYSENAARKATALADASDMLTLADDSGLEVQRLGGAPGIYSARYSSKPGATDKDRRDYLLSKLQGFPKPWVASFRCVVALAVPGGELFLAEGSCPGEIIAQERGQAGFGYDPIFLLAQLGKTMAELSMDEKNQISHRAMAINAMIPILRENL